MRLLTEDLDALGPAVALLAVHCAISLNDAIQVALTGKRSKYADHQRTAPDLERLCGSTRIDQRGVAHLRWLLNSKSAISYADKPFLDAALARDRAERFQSWAYSSFKEVLRVQELT